MEDHDPAPLLGADLRRMRKRAGLTQAELASRFGCDRTTIVRWEAGYRYRAGHERIAYGIPEEVRVQVLLVIAEAQVERRKADQEVRRRVQRLAGA